ncbi:MAG TPA: DUF6188 family protein, partial [Gemmatimonadales bacterium]
MPAPHSALSPLEGQRLTAVTFVEDYVQLQFDSAAVLTLTVPVTIQAGTERLMVPAAGSRDALCALIGREVTTAESTVAQLAIHFGTGHRILADLAKRTGPEAA